MNYYNFLPVKKNRCGFNFGERCRTVRCGLYSTQNDTPHCDLRDVIYKNIAQSPDFGDKVTVNMIRRTCPVCGFSIEPWNRRRFLLCGRCELERRKHEEAGCG